MLLGGRGKFDLAVRLRDGGAALGEVFSFVSGLYFRGKLTYARTFGNALIITPGRGLVAPETVVTIAELRKIAKVGVDPDERRFARPLERDAAELAASLPSDAIVVLLGSIATGKYVDVIGRHLDGRLRFPSEFVGRGDMSRGGLMLRSAFGRTELEYVSLVGAVRRGKRPPRL